MCGSGSKRRSRGPVRSVWTPSRWFITVGKRAAGTVLVASADRSLNTLLSTWFRRIREHDQLDLFIDGAQTAAVNALIDALAARDAGKAGRALERLVGNRTRSWATLSCRGVDRGTGGAGSPGTRSGTRTAPPDGAGVAPRRHGPARRPPAGFPGAVVARPRPGARPDALRPAPSRAPREPGVPRGTRLGAPETIGARGPGLREGAGSAHPARRGRVEAAQPRRGGRVLGSLCADLRRRSSSGWSKPPTFRTGPCAPPGVSPSIRTWSRR